MNTPPAAIPPRGFQPHLFDSPLRPLFLGAALAACGYMALWLADLGGLAAPRGYLGPFWHLHEMLFGYVMAAMGGFLLTAVPNWTRTEPLAGAPVALLAGLWLLGRLAMWLPVLPGGVAAACDVAFPAALTIALALPVARAGMLRGTVVVPMMALLTVADIAWHMDTLGIAATGRAALSLTLGMVVFAMTDIGGRIIPHFTHRVTMREVPERPWLDALCNATVLAWVAARTALPGSVWVAAAALPAALATGARLALWLHPQVRTCALTWVLHAATGWKVAGLVLSALGGFGLLPPGTATHAFTVGAMGMMTLGVMSRAALGHTGRAVTAPPGMATAFALVLLAALVRVATPLVNVRLYTLSLNVSGGLWIAAFGIYLFVYAPVLLGPEVREEDASALPSAR